MSTTLAVVLPNQFPATERSALRSPGVAGLTAPLRAPFRPGVGPGRSPDVIAEMAAYAVRRGTPIHALRLLCEMAARIAGSEAASITALVEGDALRTVVSTHPSAVTFDRLQYGIGSGPCVEALRGDRACAAEDLAADEQWPRWAARAMAAGLSSVLSVPLAATPLGSLNLYSARPRRYGSDDVAALRKLACLAAGVLGTFREQHTRWRAVDVRAVLVQSERIQVRQFGFSPSAAPTAMLRASRRDGSGPYTAAERLVRQRRLPGLAGGDEPPGGCWRN